MSIILKGIDMPKASNDDMIVIIRHDGNAEVWQSGKKETKSKAIQIPTPHGRLVDIDKVKDELKDQVPCCGLDRTYRVSNAFDTMNNAPTILDAEE